MGNGSCFAPESCVDLSGKLLSLVSYIAKRRFVVGLLSIKFTHMNIHHFNDTGTVGTNSCRGPSSCKNSTGYIGDSSCNFPGQSQCESNMGTVGDESCQGEEVSKLIKQLHSSISF